MLQQIVGTCHVHMSAPCHTQRDTCVLHAKPHPAELPTGLSPGKCSAQEVHSFRTFIFNDRSQRYHPDFAAGCLPHQISESYSFKLLSAICTFYCIHFVAMSILPDACASAIWVFCRSAWRSPVPWSGTWVSTSSILTFSITLALEQRCYLAKSISGLHIVEFSG